MYPGGCCLIQSTCRPTPTLTLKQCPKFFKLPQAVTHNESFLSSPIAERIHVRVKTVETHRQQIVKKFNSNNVAELIKTSIERFPSLGPDK